MTVRKPAILALAAVLSSAAALRAWHLDFGLPALNDPDEPIFILTALDMLREARLNPGWFGHPATLLFYLLTFIIVAVAGVGTMLGSWHSNADFVAAVFADPGVIVLPMRMLSLVLGVGSVWLTWRLGVRIGGARLGLAAALVLAANPLHVDLSQVIRTDMLATVLMGWSLLNALAIARGGRARDHVWAGIAAGLACATKWPAMLVLVAPLTATLWQKRGEPGTWRWIVVAPLIAAVTLVIVSPYLLLDHQTVLRDLGAEARPAHLGATGHGFAANILWYLRWPLAGSFGWIGAALIAVGTADLMRDRANAVTLLPFTLVFLAALASQSLVWERWFVPLLPICALLAARGIAYAGLMISVSRGRTITTGLATLALAGWMTATSAEHLSYRAHDPRQLATAWALVHIPAGRTILVESAAFDLLAYRGRILFPMGSDGCVDARALLAEQPTHSGVNRKRAGKAIVDLGHIDAAEAATCRADYYIVSNYGRYRRDAAVFAEERAIYARMLAGTKRQAVFVSSDPQLRAEGRIVEIFAVAR